MNLSKIKKFFHYKKPWPWLLGCFVLYSLLGFFLVPYLVKTNIQKFTEDRLHVTTAIESVRFNPWTFSLAINNLAMTEVSGAELLGFGRFYVNFQSSSLFRWAWSFDEIHLLGFYSRVERFSELESNISRLLGVLNETAPPAESKIEDEVAVESESSTPRLFINDAQLQISRITIIDRVPATVFQKDIGPIDLQVLELSTLPDWIGQQQVNIVTRQGAHISWSGDISIAPLASKGQVSIEGPHLNLVTEYFQDQINFNVDKGLVEAQFAYDFSLQGENLSLVVNQFNLSLKDFLYVDKTNQQPLFGWQELALKNASLKVPQQEIHVEAVDFSGGQVWVRRDQSGELNLNHLVNQPDTSTPSQPSPEKQDDDTAADGAIPAWQISNDVFALRDWQVHFEDQTLPTPASVSVSGIDVEVRGGSNRPNQNLQLNARLNVANGEVSSSGSLNINPVANIDVKYAVDQIQLPIVQPWVASLAKVQLQSGSFSVSGGIAGEAVSSLQLNAAAQLQDLLITEAGGKHKLLGWQLLAVDEAALNLANRELNINKINFDQLFADFAVYEDGSNTVGRILVDSSTEAEAEEIEDAMTGEGEALEQPPAPTSKPTEPFIYTVNNIEFKKASGRFADASLPLPFSTNINELNGNISSLVSDSKTPVQIDLDGKVNEYGQVKIQGQLAAFAPTELAQVDLIFRNINMPNLSPYTVKFAGREIDDGRMNLNLQYAIDNGSLSSENQMELFKLELGRKVEQEGAMDLPLDMALALLKDGDGKIKLTLPVSGDVNDPQFGIGQVISQAFGAMIRSVVSSPFRLLAGLVGADSEDFDKIQFESGKTYLSPPELEKVHLLAQALVQRPELQVALPGVFNEKLDGVALQNNQFEAKMKEVLGENYGNVALTSKVYLKTLEDWYREYELQPELPELRQVHTVLPTSNQTNTAGAGESKLDELSYATDLRDRLVAQENISESSLLVLAGARADVVQQELLAVDAKLSQQIVRQGNVSGDGDESLVSMELKLAAESFSAE